MRFVTGTVAWLIGASVALAVNMGAYQAGPSVDSGFEAYLKELYASAEDPIATTRITDYFTPDGELKVVSTVAHGAHDILALKQKLLPPDGKKHWNHRPGATSLESHTDTLKTYFVKGIIDTTYEGGNCSRAYYTSRFTVTQTNGVANLLPHAGNLELYEDATVDPSKSPTGIACS